MPDTSLPAKIKYDLLILVFLFCHIYISAINTLSTH